MSASPQAQAVGVVQTRPVRLLPGLIGYPLATYALAATGAPEPRALALAGQAGLEGSAAALAVQLVPVAVALVGYLVLASLRLRPRSLPSILAGAVYGLLIGLTAGLTLELFAHNPFGGEGPTLAPWQWAGALVASLMIAIGASLLLAIASRRFSPDMRAAIEYQGRAVSLGGGAVYVLQGTALAAIVGASLLDWSTPGPVHSALLIAVPLLVLAEVAAEWLTWRSTDERMRRVWLECLGATWVLGLALLALAAFAQAAALIPPPPAFAYLICGHVFCLLVSLALMALRAPDAFAAPKPGEAA